jgi:hypothetical protein
MRSVISLGGAAAPALPPALAPPFVVPPLPPVLAETNAPLPASFAEPAVAAGGGFVATQPALAHGVVVVKSEFPLLEHATAARSGANAAHQAQNRRADTARPEQTEAMSLIIVECGEIGN